MLHGDIYPHPVKDTYCQFLNELTYILFYYFPWLHSSSFCSSLTSSQLILFLNVNIRLHYPASCPRQESGNIYLMGYIPSWSPGIWGRTPVAPCNEHPVECDGAKRLRHVTTRDNDTTSECYTSATPGHSRRQPTTLVTTLVTHRVTSRDNIRDT